MDEADDVVHAQFLGALHGAVGASVVDDEVFYLVNAVDVLWQVVDSHVKCFRFVVAGYLNNKLHCFLPLLLCIYILLYNIAPAPYTVPDGIEIPTFISTSVMRMLTMREAAMARSQEGVPFAASAS